MAAWLPLSAARRANLLRALAVRRRAMPACRKRWCSGCCSELPGARCRRSLADAGRRSCACMPGRLHVVAPRRSRRPRRDAPLHLDLSRAGRADVPGWGGRFEVAARAERRRGSRSCCAAASCAQRRGGEQFQRSRAVRAAQPEEAVPGAGLPAWQRGGPLLSTATASCCYVPGLGIDARVPGARPAAPMLGLRWLPDGAAPERGRASAAAR